MAAEMLAGKMLLSVMVAAGHGGEQRIVGNGVGAGGQVIQQRQGDAPAEFDVARLAVFGGGGLDVGGVMVNVGVGQGEAAGLRGAHACVQEKEDYGLVAEHTRTGYGVPCVWLASPGRGVSANLEPGLRLVFCEGGDRGRRWSVHLDGPENVR